MSERPILFSGPMIRAILEGRKTQTRRIVSYQPSGDVIEVLPPISQYPRHWQFCYEYGGVDVPVPHQAGDMLWVRETWYCDDYRVQRGPYLKPDDMDLDKARADGILVYAADGLTPYEQEQPVWKPSIHMPRWASRIDLLVTAVKVERLQDISEADAIAEGVDLERYVPISDSAGRHACGEAEPTDPVCEFRDLWTGIHGDDPVKGWDANPWVVAYTFDRVSP